MEVLNEVDSSNNYAMQQIYDGKAVHGNAFMALCQTNGKGQRGKQWHTGKNDNLALSIVMQPSFLPLNNAFMFHTFVCVSLLQYLQQLQIKCCIKWPNDIYYNDRKAAGILIENIIQGNNWKYAVIGIGLNVNESTIQNTISKAISLQQITNKNYELATITNGILQQMQTNWLIFENNTTAFYSNYNINLYKRYQIIKLKQNDVIFETLLQKANTNGKLICGENNELEFNHGEVEWILM